ncbi:hypothetical protein D1AOALGA4SA_2390 [Olavius algarvensis Delta 1 endosymbiont]|nr:hypothetical protein D1AOALGA4SA_2390 [Olavius algarvensis Delta 1 endosymbiont]
MSLISYIRKIKDGLRHIVIEPEFGRSLKDEFRGIKSVIESADSG